MQFALQPLPAEAGLVLQRFNAVPRLVAHHILVHDVATRLTAAFQNQWPALPVDPAVVLLGAAWHDIGKVRYPEELTGPGHQHEAAGVTMLLEAGITPY